MHDTTHPSPPPLIRWQTGAVCCDDAWEAAYRRFETPAQEIRKFTRRLRHLGAADWPADARILDLFCGRGNGLKCLEEMGFTDLQGVDLSERLLAQYCGPAMLFVGDCRELKLPDRSIDVVIVQGGLHHLPHLPDDLAAVLREVRRVLVDNGRFVVVEPWLTPFLRIVHSACNQSLLRSAWPKLDALAVMGEREAATYEQWLNQPEAILGLLNQHFALEQRTIAWGKLTYRGRKGETPLR